MSRCLLPCLLSFGAKRTSNKSKSRVAMRTFGSFMSVLRSAQRSPLHRSDYASVTESDVSYFERLLGKDFVVTDETILEQHNVDWTRCYRGSSKLLLRPRNTSEVSAILSHCNERRLAVCPQGGNTGLVGGGVPVHDEIVLSLALMNRVIHLNSASGVVVCEAGCILEALDNHVGDEGLMVPLDLGARGSCHIGGNVATNAGGLRLLRYGSLHGNVLGLEVVLANGSIIDCLSVLRKDNVGYDVKQLFIGSEGTLGVITKVALLCPARSSAVNLAFLACRSFEDVYRTYKLARSLLGEVISAFEMMDQASLRIVQHYFQLRSPIEPVTKFPFYVLMETSGSNQKHDAEKIELFVEHALRDDCVEDGGLYSQTSQMRSLWALREGISSATLKDGYVYKYDLSLPPESLYGIVSDLQQRLDGKIENINGFGHIGDGNIHVNISTPQYDAQVHHLLEPYIFEWVAQRNGSISAEHGVGQQKRDYVHLCRSDDTLRLMRALKLHFDPKGILNPYKVVPLTS